MRHVAESLARADYSFTSDPFLSQLGRVILQVCPCNMQLPLINRRNGRISMTTTIDIRDLPARMHEIVNLMSAGNEVLVSDGTLPFARLLPCVPAGVRVAGLHAGMIQPTADFDAPLPDSFWTGMGTSQS